MTKAEVLNKICEFTRKYHKSPLFPVEMAGLLYYTAFELDEVEAARFEKALADGAKSIEEWDAKFGWLG